MKLTLNENSREIKIGWFFMIITIGGFLNDLKDVLQITDNNNLGYEGAYEIGNILGSKLGLITILGIGMVLYTRTKKRKFGVHVGGSKLIDYVLLFILAINFVFPLMSVRFINGTGDDTLAFFYVTSSLLAYIYALLATPKTENS